MRGLIHRIFAVVLLAAFVLPMAAQALASVQDARSALPSCCRRDGAHHCMAGMVSQPGILPAAGVRCPRLPQPWLMTSTEAVAALAQPSSFIIVPHSTLVPMLYAVNSRRTLREHSLPKRGPPAELL